MGHVGGVVTRRTAQDLGRRWLPSDIPGGLGVRAVLLVAIPVLGWRMPAPPLLPHAVHFPRLHDRLRRVRDRYDAPWYTGPWNLNVLVLRSDDVAEYDDFIIFAYEDDAERQCVHVCLATGDASAEEWIAPHHPSGCIWIRPQHAPAAHKLGDFRGRPSLLQVQPLSYSRWQGRHVPSTGELLGLPVFRDRCGTHIHPRHSAFTPRNVGRNDSWGCTVPVQPSEWAGALDLIRLQSINYKTTTVSVTYAQIADLPA